MGNQIGLVACATTMLVSGQMEISVPTYIYPIIYLVSSLLSNLLGGGGPKAGTDAAPLATGDLTYLQTKGDEARPGTLNKVVVIERWATWCGPCVQMVPHLNRIYEENKDNKHFQLVGVTSETDVAAIQSFIATHKMGYSVALDTKGSVDKGYPCQGIPNATIVGKDGKVFWNGHPGGMDVKLKEALSAPNWDQNATIQSTRPSGDSTSKSSAASSKDQQKKTD